MQDQAATAASKDFVISPVLKAPHDLVWQCFTDPERMKEWWGPKGCKVIASKMDAASATSRTGSRIGCDTGPRSAR